MKEFRPGDEYLLVDAFARELKLTDWYKWLPDTDNLPQEYASTTRPVGDEGGAPRIPNC